MTERKLPTEATRQKLSGAISLISRHLFSFPRLFPSGTSNLEFILNNRVFMLDDESYLQAKNVVYQKGDTPEIEQFNREIAHRDISTATYIHPFLSNEGKKIIIRESFVGSPDIPIINVVQVLLEELAHSFYLEDIKIKFYDLPDGTVSLLPFNTKAELLRDLNRLRATFYHEGPTDSSHISAMRSGFATFFVGNDILGKGEPIPYPAYMAQIAMEEVRGLILQSLFFAKVLGSEHYHSHSIQEQILLGMKKYVESASSKDANEIDIRKYGGVQVDGLIFLTHFFHKGSSPDDVISLISQLHDSEPEIFLRNLKVYNIDALASFQRIFDREFKSLAS